MDNELEEKVRKLVAILHCHAPLAGRQYRVTFQQEEQQPDACGNVFEALVKQIIALLAELNMPLEEHKILDELYGLLNEDSEEKKSDKKS